MTSVLGTSVTLGVASAHGLASVANDVIMRKAGLVTSGTSDWRQAWVASAIGACEPCGLEQRSSVT